MSEVLFLAHRIPYPPNRGDKIRSFHILERLCRHARVHLATFADDAADAAHETALGARLGDALASSYVRVRRRSRAASLVAGTLTGRSASTAAFADSGMRRHVARLLRERPIAGVFAFSGQMGQYAPEKAGKRRFVMDFVDVDSAKFESYADEAAYPLNRLYRREAAQLAREEARIAARADHSLFVTGAEAELFQQRSAAPRVRALENGVDLDGFNPDAAFAPLTRPPGERLLVFTGQMDYAPNVQAVSHFARDIFPRIRAKVGSATFAIVGRTPSAPVQALAQLPGVEVTGSVPDVRPWLAAADAVVAPLRIARGVQNKVLEAMAMGRPVVASSPAFEGIDAVPGLDLLVADGAEASAAAVLSLLGDEELAAKVGRAARARAATRYSWERQLADLPALVLG